MTDEFSVDKLPSRYFTEATRYYCYAPCTVHCHYYRRRYSSSPPTTAATGNSTSVSVSEASRDEYDDQPVKSSSKLDDDGTSMSIGH